jgi:thiamine transport system substrate-binding protein
MKRRTFIAAAGTVAVAGCTVSETDDESNGNASSGNGSNEGIAPPAERAEMDFSGESLTVGTFDVFVDAPSDSPGEWIKSEFEDRYGVEFNWAVPDGELSHYVQRHNQGVEIEPELYLGVRPQNLARADRQINGQLFAETDTELLRNGPDIGEEFFFDPQDRAVPGFLSHCAIVYDGRNLPEPETFEDLTSDVYEGDLAIPNPAQSTTGLLFLLWTINEFGADGYLDYWEELLANGASIVESWGTVYTQFLENEAPIIVSFSNDRVYAQRAGNSLDKHRVALLNGQGYANITGAARFAEGTQPDLAYEFIDFMLEPETQALIAERNVTGPVNETAEPPAVFQEYAQQPEESVFFDYEELSGNLEGWINDWSRQVAGGN